MSVYRLAICEDDPVLRKELSLLCREILEEEEIEPEIQEYASAVSLEAELGDRPAPFDLLVLDIQMEGMTGMELARRLRARKDRVSILFVTGCEEYLPEGYCVQPIQFLLKPVRREALAEALRTDWEWNHQAKTLALRAGKGRTILLPVAEIRYVESFNHRLVVHLEQAEQTCVLSLAEIESLLPPGQFCRCHNSYLVNLEFLASISRSGLELRDGSRLPVGRAYYDPLQSAFVRYLNR